MKVPNDMPPIKDNKNWLVSILCSIVALLFLPIGSMFWLLMIIPISLSVFSIVFSYKNFVLVKQWIVSLVCSIVVSALCLFVCAQMVCGCVQSFFQPKSYYFEYTFPFEQEDTWSSFDWY